MTRMEDSGLWRGVRKVYDRITTMDGALLRPRFAALLVPYMFLSRRGARAGESRRLRALKYFNRELNRTELLLGRETLRSRPVRMRIGVTRRCNLRCWICGVSRRGSRENAALESAGAMDIPMEDYRALAEEAFPYLSELEFNQNGEALARPDLMEMLEIADSRGVDITISTNAMLLTDEIMERLMALDNLKCLVVSMDGARPETLEGIRVGADHGKLVRNLQKLAAIRGRGKRPELEIHFAAMRSNIEELPELVEMAGKMGLDRVSVSYLYLDTWMPVEESLYFHKELANSIFHRVEASRGDVEVWLPPRFGTRPERAGVCELPWNFPAVEPDGDIMPCCMLFGPEYSMGGAEKGLEPIWNGPRYRELRRSLLRGEPLFDKCRWCGFDPAALDPDDLRTHMTPELISRMEKNGRLGLDTARRK